MFKCGESKGKADLSAHMFVNASKTSIVRAKCVDVTAAERGASTRKDVKVCVVCGVSQQRASFSDRTWGDVADCERNCKHCVGAEAGRPMVCVACEVGHWRDSFSSRMWASVADRDRKCKRCVDADAGRPKVCVVC